MREGAFFEATAEPDLIGMGRDHYYVQVYVKEQDVMYLRYYPTSELYYRAFVRERSTWK
jgi:hypothetical protein